MVPPNLVALQDSSNHAPLHLAPWLSPSPLLVALWRGEWEEQKEKMREEKFTRSSNKLIKCTVTTTILMTEVTRKDAIHTEKSPDNGKLINQMAPSAMVTWPNHNPFFLEESFSPDHDVR